MSNSCDPWTVAGQAPLSMGFSRQEYWRGLSFPSPGHLPEPGIKPGSPALQADSLLTELQGTLSGSTLSELLILILVSSVIKTSQLYLVHFKDLLRELH